jgi:DEAD/DEAH box helicase domain-containing protein
VGNIVYFDLETQMTANDVGGWDKKDKMRMSVGVTYNTASAKYTIYPESRAEELVRELQRADLVVGFNIEKFDYAVLMGYTILDLPQNLRTLDLLLDLEARLGFRMKLESLAKATLGVGKTADGLDAIRWWREGRLLDIARYCCFDVKVTRLVHEFGRENGHVFYFDRNGRRQQVAVDWK